LECHRGWMCVRFLTRHAVWPDIDGKHGNGLTLQYHEVYYKDFPSDLTLNPLLFTVHYVIRLSASARCGAPSPAVLTTREIR
jgi:hypothetical protein